jgi:hypothetical protein
MQLLRAGDKKIPYKMAGPQHTAPQLQRAGRGQDWAGCPLREPQQPAKTWLVADSFKNTC